MKKEIVAKQAKRLRIAIYARISSDMQEELSIEAQIERCTKAIIERGGVVAGIFKDTAKSGWSLDRDGFNDLRHHASHAKFDAVMFWKFDRLARDHEHTVMIKMLLRKEYGLKLFCVEGGSQDDDNSAHGSLMEQMLAVFSAFYSKNLSSETKRGKLHRASHGEFNGSVPPIGYILVKKSEATDDNRAGLHVDIGTASIVHEAFARYATKQYSDSDIARWMNSQSVVAELRKNKQPVNKEMVRDMLQNRVYTGRVRYTETLYRGTLGERRGTKRNRSTWYEGKHEALISDELFEQCQQVRAALERTRKTASQARTYILQDRVYCARCIKNKDPLLNDNRYGTMRPAWSERSGTAHFRCTCRDRGYEKCGQGYVRVETIESQVVAALRTLTIPTGLQERIENALRQQPDHETAFARIAEIEAEEERVKLMWRKGHLLEAKYTEAIEELIAEKNSTYPIDYDDALEAADLLQHFSSYWDQCANVPNPTEARQQLVAKIIDRVFVYDDKVIAVALRGDFAVPLNETGIAPQQVIAAIAADVENKKGGNISENVSTHCGDDGPRVLACILLLIPPFAVVDNPLFNAFVRKIAEARDAKWYFAPRSLLSEPIPVRE